MENDGVYNNSFTVRRIEMLDNPGMSMVRVPRSWIDSLEKQPIGPVYDEFRSFEVRKEEYDPEAYYVIMDNKYAIGFMESVKDSQVKRATGSFSEPMLHCSHYGINNPKEKK